VGGGDGGGDGGGEGGGGGGGDGGGGDGGGKGGGGNGGGGEGGGDGGASLLSLSPFGLDVNTPESNSVHKISPCSWLFNHGTARFTATNILDSFE
jgi:hypothetical protein